MWPVDEVHVEAAAVVGSIPPFAVDQDLGGGWLHANRQRAVILARARRRFRWRHPIVGAHPVWSRSILRLLVVPARGGGRLRRHRAFARLARRQRLHHLLDRDRALTPEENRGADGLVALEVERELVLAGVDTQPLQRAVEVVDRADQIAVNEDLGLLRRDLKTGGPGQVVDATVVGVGIRVIGTVAITKAEAKASVTIAVTAPEGRIVIAWIVVAIGRPDHDRTVDDAGLGRGFARHAQPNRHHGRTSQHNETNFRSHRDPPSAQARDYPTQQ